MTTTPQEKAWAREQMRRWADSDKATKVTAVLDAARVVAEQFEKSTEFAEWRRAHHELKHAIEELDG